MDVRRQRYVQARRIVLAAVELPAPRQAVFLAAECGDDVELMAEVRWQLAALEDTTSTDFLSPPGSPVADASGTSVAAATRSDYRIERLLGEGGMGAVYLAEREIDGVLQQVALKFLHAAGPPGGEPLRRFVDERRILARLRHPNIAHLIDVGSTTDGRPYLALEYVEGERIDHWCERRRLPLRERVALFLKVCAAVQYAHAHLVIHRDIKPANILVTAEGEPKLLDFGIARLLDAGDGAPSACTTTMHRALTLAYASPEQLDGRPLGTAADVWSLGVVLYQLLCGALPFVADDEASALELHRAIATGRLVPPGRRLRQREGKAGREVPADVDAIVLRALRRDPAERYASVEALATDLRSFLAMQPVQARRGQRAYRLRLFVRRHRLGVGLAALALLLLAGFAGEREAQLRRVELERDKTEAMAGFMGELFENADPTHAHGNRITVREALDRGVAQLQARRDIAPAVRAALMLSIGRAYNALDMGGKAIPLLRDAVVLQAQPGGDDGTLARGRTMAALGRAYSMVIDLPSSIAADREALGLLAEAHAPGDEIVRVRINKLYSDIAVLDIPLAQSAAELGGIAKQLAARPAPNLELLAQALAALSMAQAAGGDDRAAMATAQRSLDTAMAFYTADDPALIYYRFAKALVSMRDDPAGAVALYRRAIADYDRMYGAAGPGLAGLLAYFGGALAQLGQNADAAQALERALRIAEGFAADSPDFYLSTLVSLAQQYLELGRDGDALALLQPRREQLAQRAAGHSAWAVISQADALNVLAAVALRQGRADEAAGDFRQALAALGPGERQVSPDSYAAALAGQGEAALAAHHPEQAAQALAQLDDFDRARKAAAEDVPALDAALLRARLAQARGDAAGAFAAAAPAAALAAHRWGDCSRRAVALRGLGGATAGSPPACAAAGGMAVR